MFAYFYIDMFSPTDSGKKAVDMFPRTDDSNDINAINSRHVECVALIEKK